MKLFRMVAALLLLSACLIVAKEGPGDSGVPALPDAGPDASISTTFTPLPCEIADLVQRNCSECHGARPAFGGPMPLVSREHFLAKALSDGSRTYASVAADRIADTKNPMPPSTYGSLSANDRSKLSQWLTSGAPAGAACVNQSDAGPAPKEAGVTIPQGSAASVGPLTCTPDMRFAAPSAWEMPTATRDEYVCYGVEITAAQKRQLIAIAPRVQNTTIVHHLLLFQSPTAVSPTPAPCNPAGGVNWRMIYGWAPGGPNLTLPAEAGFPLEGQAHYVVQVHYSNLRALTGERDTSGFDACSTDQLRPYDADVLAFGTTNFTIQGRSSLDITCDLKVPTQFGNFNVIASFPHMHKLGTSIATEIRPADGTPAVDIGRNAPWDFDNQPWLGVRGTVKAGDTVRTRCAWTNPSNQPVGFGEETADEMCYSFTMYYPRITSPVWSWQIPAFQSRCQPTP